MRTNFVKQENSHEPSSVNKAAVHTTLENAQLRVAQVTTWEMSGMGV